MIGIIFQHLITLILTAGATPAPVGGAGWRSKGETNTAADRKGNTSGTFRDWGIGKTVPVVQSPPNLHQVSGIRESISALAFHVWLNHPGQCVRCWTKLILALSLSDSQRRGRRIRRGEGKEKEDVGLSKVKKREHLVAKVASAPCLIKTSTHRSNFIILP